jgi:hypothetical protein
MMHRQLLNAAVRAGPDAARHGSGCDAGGVAAARADGTRGERRTTAA